MLVKVITRFLFANGCLLMGTIYTVYGIQNYGWRWMTDDYMRMGFVFSENLNYISFKYVLNFKFAIKSCLIKPEYKTSKN